MASEIHRFVVRNEGLRPTPDFIMIMTMKKITMTKKRWFVLVEDVVGQQPQPHHPPPPPSQVKKVSTSAKRSPVQNSVKGPARDTAPLALNYSSLEHSTPTNTHNVGGVLAIVVRGNVPSLFSIIVRGIV